MLVPRLTVGSATVYFLNDGFWWDDGGAMFGVVPKALWNKEKPADANNKIHMSLVSPLLLVDNEIILIDTGIGNRLAEREQAIYRPERGAGLAGGMRALGMAPDDVTLVVLSHLHFDHCGGVIDRGGSGATTLAFPKARHVIQRREYETALRPSNARDAAAYSHAAECLAPVAGRHLELVDGDMSLTPRVRTVMTGGHTPAHQSVVVEDVGAGLIHLADIAPTAPHLRPTWTAAYDLDPLASLEAKARILTEARAKNWWVSFDHDDRVASGHLAGTERRPTVIDSIRTPQPPED